MVGIKRVKKKNLTLKQKSYILYRKKLHVLLLRYRNQSTYSTKDFYAKAWISSNDGRDYYGITAWYINNMHCLNNFIDRVKIELNKATIKNKIYLIKFDFGSNSKTFKYKHE